MSMTISLEPGLLQALASEAAARNITCEQVICEVLEDYFACPQTPDPEYDAFFRAKVEEGRKAIREGRVYTNEEVEMEVEKRRERLLAKIAAQK